MADKPGAIAKDSPRGRIFPSCWETCARLQAREINDLRTSADGMSRAKHAAWSHLARMSDLDGIERWVAAIASYLAAHPNASDTAEGVARWWVRADYADWWKVRLALDSMVRQGVLVRHVAADGRQSYRNARP